MKNFMFVTLAILAGICTFFSSCFVMPIIGNGEMETTNRTVSSFKKVSISGSADMYYHRSQEYRVEVTIDSNLIEYLEIKDWGNTLDVGLKPGYSYNYTKMIIDIYCPEITGVTISGSGRFTSEEVITVSKFEVTVSGSGKIDAEIETEYFNVTISGSGKVDVTGTSNNLNTTISGSGSLYCSNLSVNDATIKITGSGNANIHVTDTLKVTITGSGNIKYYGNPSISSSITGSGKIQKM